VDLGEHFVDRPRVEAAVGSVPGSLRLGHFCKTRYTVEEVQRKEDAPALDISIEYTPELTRYRLAHVLPPALLGSLAAAASGAPTPQPSHLSLCGPHCERYVRVVTPPTLEQPPAPSTRRRCAVGLSLSEGLSVLI
jgi:hypothetical protein